MSSAGSSFTSDTVSSPSSTSGHEMKQDQEAIERSSDDSGSESESSEDARSEAEGSSGDESDAPVLSHAAQRKRKKKALKDVRAPADAPAPAGKQEKVKNTAELAPSKAPRRQNSVWVGNLSFRTTPDALRGFFDGVGEITRVHMPMKMASGRPGDNGARKENRGFAYVDFATADARVVAIALSEKPLDGRRLLIKDGGDFNGRPVPPADAAAGAGADASAGKSSGSGTTKTSQKILSAQKHPAGPTLFLGNLSFETTEASIRELLVAHWKQQKPDDADDASSAWLRKVRMGTFEDSGKCKGWAFVDFTSTEHATAALTNPRNHRLHGRELVMEYASPDAVRRGGGGGHAQPRGPQQARPDAAERQPPSKRKYRTEESETDVQAVESREKWRRLDSGPPRPDAAERQSPSKRKYRTEESEADGQTDMQAVGSREKRRRLDSGPPLQGPDKKPQREGRPPRARAKPGAALAQAKREMVGIVPSQGQKIVF